MLSFLEVSRRITRFLLALLLWAHAFFLVGNRSGIVEFVSKRLHFSFVETVLLLLLLLFSFLAGSGYWQTIKNLIYIYLFPLILLLVLIVGVSRLLWKIGRPFLTDTISRVGDLPPKTIDQVAVAVTAETAMLPAQTQKPNSHQIFEVITRPFRRFTLLWCILLLRNSSSHILGCSHRGVGASGASCLSNHPIRLFV